MSLGSIQTNVYFGITVGFFLTIAIASAIDRFGDAMFKRGVARPFFVGRHRLHHRSFLFVAVPAGYVAVAALILTGYVQIVWSLFWTGIAGTFLVAIDCLIFDLTIDYASKSRGWGLLRHELIYTVIPLYAFSAFLRFAI